MLSTPPEKETNIDSSCNGIVNSLQSFISLFFLYATKIGYEGFGNLWSVRFMGFATSMLTFPIMTYFYLGEVVTLKTAITILLAIVIMILQFI